MTQTFPLIAPQSGPLGMTKRHLPLPPANAFDRELYERTKRELARREWKYTQNYADAKTTVVEEILARARKATEETKGRD